MEKKQEILESRKRLDKSLCLPDLVNGDSIAFLIKEQLVRSSLRNNGGDLGKIVESRTEEVANFLEMLRSASESDSSHLTFHKDWKVKQDTDQLRVMYSEGPHGSPFHTLLAEGFADGPMDVCLCVSWELTLYKKWWPQYSVPTFRIIASSCLQKVQIGEEISLIRMKVPWPISDREAVLHYFEIEYFKEDLILVLIKTLSDTEHIDADTHGFRIDGIPQAKDTVRIDLVGGFVLQKVETNRCYFRAIFNFDIKLDFLPPSLINFISRQLVGNGHKLFQKAVRSVAATDEDYRAALQEPLYVQIRRQLHSHNKPGTSLEDFDKEKLDEHTTDTITEARILETRTSVSEIIEEDLELADTGAKNIVVNGLSEKQKSSISPEVEHALDVLDQVITIVRDKNYSKNGDVPESSNKSAKKSEGSSCTDNHRHDIMSSPIFEAADNEVTLPSQKERNTVLKNSQLLEPKIDLTHSFSKVCDEGSLETNGFFNRGHPSTVKTKKKSKNMILCCLSQT